MRVTNFEQLTPWSLALRAARTTANKSLIDKMPSEAFRMNLCRSEHSPVRALIFTWVWEDLPSWVSVHFVRHKLGIEHFVSTQRTDRTGIDRDKKPQDAPVTHMCIADGQALINISRKRLCNKAAYQTRKAWKLVLDEVHRVCPELWLYCVPECVSRGYCPEFKSCGAWDVLDTKSIHDRRTLLTMPGETAAAVIAQNATTDPQPVTEPVNISDVDGNVVATLNVWHPVKGGQDVHQ